MTYSLAPAACVAALARSTWSERAKRILLSMICCCIFLGFGAQVFAGELRRALPSLSNCTNAAPVTLNVSTGQGGGLGTIDGRWTVSGGNANFFPGQPTAPAGPNTYIIPWGYPYVSPPAQPAGTEWINPYPTSGPPYFLAKSVPDGLTYVYTTQFNISASSWNNYYGITVSGLFSADDDVTSIALNGHPFGGIPASCSAVTASCFLKLYSFSFNQADFQKGTNTLAFTVQNTGQDAPGLTPTSLLVSATVTAQCCGPTAAGNNC